MTAVKFSILALLAGGFCTLLGVGIWMGPQETACSAQSAAVASATTVAVAAPSNDASCKEAACDKPPCAGRCDAPVAVAKQGTCSAKQGTCSAKGESCSGAVCETLACTGDSCETPVAAANACEKSSRCESGACEVVAAPHPSAGAACPESFGASYAAVPALPPASSCAASGSCATGFCDAPPTAYPSMAPGAPVALPYWAGFAVPPTIAPDMPPAPYAPYPTFAPACVAPAYPSPVGQMSSYAEMPSPVVGNRELIEALLRERDVRLEAHVEALEAAMELRLEAQESVLKAQHEAEIAGLKAEAAIKVAELTQALREEKALLHLVADGTISTQALQSMIARNQANAGATRPVSTAPAPIAPASAAAGCKCEKCACETCKCGTDAACKCTTCKCEGCACPGCDKAVSISTKAGVTCEGKACRAACANCETSCKTCEPCKKECGARTFSAQTLELIGVEFDLVCDAEGCTIATESEPQSCPTGACQGSKAACPAATCPSQEVAKTQAEPFICEKDGCEMQRLETGEGVPILSKIPYISRLFENQGQVLPSPYFEQDDVQYFPPGVEFKAQQK